MREKRWMVQMFKYIHLEELAWKSTMSVAKTTHAKWRDCMIQDDLPNSWCVMGFRKAHDDFWTNVDFEDVAFNLVLGNTIVLLLSCYAFPMNSSNVEFGSCFSLQPSNYRLYIAMFSCSKIVPLFCTVCFLKCKIDLVYPIGT
jgi:hypothetical protein